MPLDQRQRGVALAQGAVGAKPTKKVAVAKPAPAKPPSASPPPAKISVPAPPPAAVAVVARGGGWRVQLGAFGKRSAAEALFARLGGGALAGRQAYYVPVGAITRLQAGPFATKAEAAAACARLKRPGLLSGRR